MKKQPRPPRPPSNPVDQAIVTVRAWVGACGQSKAALARKAGISERSIGRIETADWSPTTDQLRRLVALVPAEWRPGDPVPAVADRGASAAAKGEASP